MQRTRQTPSFRPLRVLIVDAHEVSRAACSALLRTEGLFVADVAPGDHVVGLAQALEPEVVLIDAGPGAPLRDTAQQLRALTRAPLVLLTSSAEHDQLHPLIRELPFLAKADVCAEAILRAVAAARGEQPVVAASE
jgi:DNA-binding NarL/FixJ family response regulator